MLEDLEVDSRGWVQVKNGQRGAFVLEAFTAGVVEGAVTEKGLEAKIPAGTLDLGPVDFTYAGVHVKCTSASVPDLLLTLRVAAGKAPAGGEAPLQITLEHAEAPLVHVEGLEFELLSLAWCRAVCRIIPAFWKASPSTESRPCSRRRVSLLEAAR